MKSVIYYGLPIGWKSNSLENMKSEIWTLFHKISTDENPQHKRCSALPNKGQSGRIFRDKLLNRCLGG